MIGGSVTQCGSEAVETKGKAIACYVRVSTVGQNEAGQVAEIERWLRGSGISPETVRWFCDKKTGDTLRRPEFERMQAEIFAGEIGTVVCYKVDRLSRKLRQGINVLAEWCDRGLRVVSVTQQIDFNGTVGRLLAAVLLSIAEMEQETRKERQMAGIAAARARGVYTGRAKGSTKANPARALELRQKGLTAAEIAASLKVSEASVWRYFRAAKAKKARR